MTASSEISTKVTGKASFAKGERLCGVKPINDLFATGNHVRLNWFRALYSVAEGSAELSPARLLISVPKRYFKKAVMRNLLRRRIREAYRKNKFPLTEYLTKNGKHMDLAIIWSSPGPADYGQIEESVKELIRKLTHVR